MSLYDKEPSKPLVTTSPYSTAPARSFWSRAVTKEFHAEDLYSSSSPLLRSSDLVTSAGSCFAANIVGYLQRSGFQYLRTEIRHPLLRAAPEDFGYDNFSAAYGNIYTARQLLQLLRRSIGTFQAEERVWEIGKDFIDPFRPGLKYRARSLPEFEAMNRQHLSCVRQAFEQATVFIFTLGLTESWISKQDGAVFPACPGTIAGVFDPDKHTFHNLSVSEVVSDLNEFVQELRRINNHLSKVILTVSPVPLVATATGGHVLEATIYSKSVLRVAADEVAKSNKDVTYFPAYEIVTGPQAPESYYRNDKRNVSESGVEVVMQAFLAHCESNITTIGGVHKQSSMQSDSAALAARVQELGQSVGTAECEEVMSDPYRENTSR